MKLTCISYKRIRETYTVCQKIRFRKDYVNKVCIGCFTHGGNVPCLHEGLNASLLLQWMFFLLILHSKLKQHVNK